MSTWRSTADHYGRLAMLMHWGVLLLIVGVYGTMEWREFVPKEDPLRGTLRTWHLSLGLIVFASVWLRLLLRAIEPTPAITPPLPAWQELPGRVMHWALYAMMIVLPVTGYLMGNADDRTVSFFGLPLPRLIGPDKALGELLEEIHEIVANAGYFLIALHSAAGLFHHYVQHDTTLARMLPSGSRPSGRAHHV